MRRHGDDAAQRLRRADAQGASRACSYPRADPSFGGSGSPERILLRDRRESPFVHDRKTLPKDAGLTLVEVLTAVSLLGIVTAVAATNFTAMAPAFRTRGAALAIAGDLNQARMAAIKEARVYEYFPISGGYQIRRDDGVGGRELVKQRVIGTEYPHVVFGHTGISEDPYAGAIASSVPTAAITFHSNGTVQNAAGVFLEAPSSDGLVQQAVTMSAAGRVRVWRHTEDGWR